MKKKKKRNLFEQKQLTSHTLDENMRQFEYRPALVESEREKIFDLKRENKQRQEAERRRYFVSGCKDNLEKMNKRRISLKKEEEEEDFKQSSVRVH